MKEPTSRTELLDLARGKTLQSGHWWTRAQKVLPGGLTSRTRKFQPYPFYAEKAAGAYIWDIDGQRYLDCCMSFGMHLLGHGHPAITKAIASQLKLGTIFGTPHKLEVEYAEKLVRCSPCAEMVLICNTGTEATMQGIRIARAFSGKPRIAKFEGGYHGWHDHVLWSTDLNTDSMGPAERPNAVAESAGMPQSLEPTLLMLPYEEAAFDRIREHASELAVVMIEPVLGGWTLPVEKAFLQRLREVTKQAGVLLLFDEVITGFRLALGGAQELYGVVPDIVIYGKIIGGGLPIGAVGCSAEIMSAVVKQDPPLAIAGSFSGNSITLAGGNAMLDYVMEHPEIYKEMAERGDHLRSSFDEFARKKGIAATMTGVGSMFQAHLVQPPANKPRDFLNEDMEPMRDFQLLLRHQGVFIPLLHLGFISAVHQGREIEQLLRAHKTSLEMCYKVRHE